MQVQPYLLHREQNHGDHSANVLRRLIKGVLSMHANRVLTSDSINKISAEISEQFDDQFLAVIVNNPAKVVDSD